MVLITGASGFIGRRVAKLSLKYYKKSQIVCLVKDNLNSWEQKARKNLNNLDLKINEVNLITKTGLKGIPQSPKTIIHLAAITDTSFTDFSPNDLGVKNLYKNLGQLGPKNHIIYTGTTAIMAGRKKCTLPINEQDLPNPTNEYGRTKLAAEKFLIDKCSKDNFCLTIVRLTTVYGSNPRVNSLFDMMQELVLKRSILARLNWPGLTGLIHVDDVAWTILEISKNPPSPGNPQIIILNTENLSLSQISKIIHNALKIPYQPINLPTFFYKICSLFRPIIYASENLFPGSVYNLLWRATLIVDNVIFPDNKKFRQLFPKRKLKTLKKTIKEVIG